MVKLTNTLFFSFILFFSCGVGFEKLTNQPKDYVGNTIKTNGYYYNIRPVGPNDNRLTLDLIFFYKNGIIYDPIRIIIQDSLSFEKEYLDEKNKYNSWEKDKSIAFVWGIFFQQDNELQIESWDTSTGGKHPRIFDKHQILNDSTILIHDYTFKFRTFSPKPDSTNQFTHSFIK